MGKHLACFFVLFGALLLPGCAKLRGTLDSPAQDRSQLADFAGRAFNAGPFMIQAFERVSKPGQVATVYIEGDGVSFDRLMQENQKPAPEDPIALKLALQDPSVNVIYLSQPCQYISDKRCESTKMSERWLSQETVSAMDEALNNLRQQYYIPSFHMVGFGSGGAVVTLLAGRRDDVISVSTLSGYLDTDALARYHGRDPMPNALNPARVATNLVGIPQRHFFSPQNRNLPLSIGRDYADASGQPECIRLVLVGGAHQDKDWPAVWRKALLRPIESRCQPSYD